MMHHFRKSAFSVLTVLTVVCGFALAQEGVLQSNAEADMLAEQSPSAPTDSSQASLETRLGATVKALAVANEDLDSVRKEYERLRYQMEALGIAAITNDAGSIRDRLIKAAADLNAEKNSRKELLEHSSRLADAGSAFLNTPGNSAAREAFQSALQAFAKSSLPEKEPLPAINDARVVSFKPELGLIVINSGRKSGLRLGTPMEVRRIDTTVATGLIVDVRDNISGVLLTDSSSTSPVRVGDTLKPQIAVTSSDKQ